ncbi:PREDICTED: DETOXIFICATION 45 chloroplastic, partial [Prunus dulcis]
MSLLWSTCSGCCIYFDTHITLFICLRLYRCKCLVQDVSNLGVFYLVNFVEGKQVEMPQQTKLKLTGNPRGRLVTYSETQSLM